MQVQLTAKGYLCLIDHILPGSPVHEILKRAVKVPAIGQQQPEWYVVDIDLNIAEFFLKIARVRCPSALKNLERAVRELKARANPKS